MIVEKPKIQDFSGLQTDEKYLQFFKDMESEFVGDSGEVSTEILDELTRALKEALSKPEIERELRKIYTK